MKNFLNRIEKITGITKRKYNIGVTLVTVISTILSFISSFIDLVRNSPSLSLLMLTFALIMLGLIVSISYLIPNRHGKKMVSTKQKYPSLSIVSIMRAKRSDDTKLGMSFLLVGVVVERVFSTLFGQTPNNLVSTIFVLMSIFLFIRKITFDYRVQSGVYGNNENEAREIIAFIIKESEKIDFTDSGKRKSLIGNEDLDTMRQQLKDLIPGMAGTD